MVINSGRWLHLWQTMGRSFRRLVEPLPTAGHGVQRWVRDAARIGLNLVFPPHCALCGVPLAEGAEDLFCDECRADLVDRQTLRCPACGLRGPSLGGGPILCGRCSSGRRPIDRALVLGDYSSGLREAVLRMKRAHQEALVGAMAGLLATRIRETGFADPQDLVVPMPIHRIRRFRRWTNVAEVLAAGIADGNRLALARNLLKYQRPTRKQGTLTRRQRIVNLRGAMSANRAYDLSGRTVLLVDDVLTSGATSGEAARVCRGLGAARIKLAVAARSSS